MVGNAQYYTATDPRLTIYFGPMIVEVEDEPPRRRMVDWIPERGKGLRDRLASGVRLPARRSVRPTRRCSAAM